MILHAHCPGCGDRGDAAHIAACAYARMLRPFTDGALWLLLVVEKQLHRRGVVDWGRLMSAVAHCERERHLGRTTLHEVAHALRAGAQHRAR